MIRPISLFLACAVVFSFGQAPLGIMTILQENLRQQKYDVVISRGEEFLSMHKDAGQGGQQVTPLLLEAYAQTNDYAHFTASQESYLLTYPAVTEGVRVHYLSGIVRAQQGNFVGAVLALDSGLVLHEKLQVADTSYQQLILKNLDKITKLHLLQGQRDTLLVQVVHPQTSAMLKKGSVTPPPASAEAIPVAATPQAKRIPPVIALLAPLSGDFADLGSAASYSAQIAVEEYNKRNATNYSLRVYDTKGQPLETARQVQKIQKDSVALILGPIMSNTATVAAAMLGGSSQKVMITPTATDEGIAPLGSNIYQLNLTSGVVAQQLADYAVKVLKITQFAILMPTNEYGETMASQFSASVKKLGGTVVVQPLSPRMDDYQLALKELKTHYANLKFGRPETLQPAQVAARKEYLDNGVVAVGGLFIPASDEQVLTIAGTLSLHKIEGQLLGGNTWHTMKMLQNGSTLAQNAIFVSQEKVDLEGSSWLAFSQTYKARYKSEPHKLVSPLVYDATNLILLASHNAANLEAVKTNLQSQKAYAGLSGVINLADTRGVNSQTVVMKVSGENFLRLR